MSDNLNLEVILSDWELDRTQDSDFDGSEFTFTTDINNSIDENDTIEVHLTGQSFNGRLDWIAGYYSLDQHTKSRTYRWTMLDLPRAGTTGAAANTLRVDAQAYLQQWRATVGLPATPATIFGRQTTKRDACMLTVVHAHEHLGQLIAYARSNGITPPWSAQGGQ